tara:strand:- start:276 stop:461 length:186 start_codon:yes stop_codon:yes gene_type:complete
VLERCKIGGFYAECSLHYPANSMLVIAFAGLNIEQAVIYKTCGSVNHSIHLIPQGRNVLID